MNQKSICIILVCPEHPSNIGSVARAMNNMGVSELRLVNPCDYLKHGSESAMSLAMHSHTILLNAKVYSSLQDAVSDKNFIIGTTNRIRGHHKFLHSAWTIKELLKTNNDFTFVFGRESSGLTNSEIDLCNHLLTIPTFGTSHSLNLAQAVMVVLYETSKYLNSEVNAIQPSFKYKTTANSEHIEMLKNNIMSFLQKINYIKNGNDKKRKSVFSKLLAEKKLTAKEVNIIQGIIQKAENKIDSLINGRQ
ncbi:RNA methyltransferase [Pigmentibacter sp. JX0631]|uniref:RNA methyltransferase n=1 Tax=Pigmentibacter sp. JX0631 TaxID=2976982 RepID=UPI00246866B2|nr:RNA methyltransferase [Pigmentibacter sp. JX0631]WGL61152.1 RNA methyltransferase [Pigmentibacter sp. JX0631]